VIAIDVQADTEDSAPHEEHFVGGNLPFHMPGALRDIVWSSTMMIARITQMQLERTRPALYLRAPVPVDVSMFLGFQRAREIIAAGEVLAENALPRIRALLDK
jgi:predicted acylesterase/phospholipase RssA